MKLLGLRPKRRPSKIRQGASRLEIKAIQADTATLETKKKDLATEIAAVEAKKRCYEKRSQSQMRYAILNPIMSLLILRFIEDENLVAPPPGSLDRESKHRLIFPARNLIVIAIRVKETYLPQKSKLRTILRR
jgi:hypothetical protein